jgi:hypothetical protein
MVVMGYERANDGCEMLDVNEIDRTFPVCVLILSVDDTV